MFEIIIAAKCYNEFYFYLHIIYNDILQTFDPLGRPTDPSGSDHYFLTDFRPYVRPHFSKSQNKTNVA